MKLRYFAWLRTRIGHGEENLDPPATVVTTGDLVAWLSTRGPGYAAALADPRLVRIAVNQDHVGLDHPVRAGDEVALFPPVTGG